MSGGIREVRFCDDLAFLSAEAKARPRSSTEVVLTKHTLPLKELKVDVRHVTGVAHNRTTCTLCREGDHDDPFLDVEVYEIERTTALSLQVINRATARDAITWVAAHREWLRIPRLKAFFENNYVVLAEAIAAVNSLGPDQIDGRISATLRSEIYDVQDLPIYCSWLLLPNAFLSRVFYVPTRVPTDEMVHDYLNVMLGLPREFTENIVYRTHRDEQQKDRVLRRRLSSQKLLKSPRPVDAQAGHEVEDPRNARANRLDKRSDLRALFNVQNPRLVLISEFGHIEELQDRPDYVFHPHPQYINVFFMTLPPEAPAIYEPEPNNW
jgi:hypothetical protein